MNIEHLVAHKFSPEIIRNWKERYAAELLPLQASVVTDTGLLRGNNLVVFAPTSSGKTFIGEMAAVRHWQHQRKSVFLAPTKALAEEQYAHLDKLYSPLGIRVVVSTAERTLFDTRIVDSEFDFAVMVYEKLKVFMTISPMSLASLGLVVVDEMQIIGDSQRGDSIDLLLTCLTSRDGTSRPLYGLEAGNSRSHGRTGTAGIGHIRPQVVCLSAVLSENSRPADWLNSELFVWRERPVELREGVLRADTGVFRYRETNSGKEGEEKLMTPNSELLSASGHDYEFNAVLALTAELCARGERVLIFVPTRRMSQEWGYALAHTLGLEPAEEALAALEEHEMCAGRRLLEEQFKGGVSTHNADFAQPVRALIEEQFRRGNIRVLVATSTLAQGVNLSADTVISIPKMYQSTGTQGGFVPLSRQRFRNQGGRAGRVRGDLDNTQRFGRSILIAMSQTTEINMWREYIGLEVEPLEPAIGPASFDRMVLDLVESKRATKLGSISHELLRTYSGMILWSAQPAQFSHLLQVSCDRLCEIGLIVKKGANYESTEVGHAAAAFGIQTETARQFIAWCSEVKQNGLHDAVAVFEAIAIAAFSPDGAQFSAPAVKWEDRDKSASDLLEMREDLQLDLMTDTVRRLVECPFGLNREGQAALRKALMAEAWISPKLTQQIESTFMVFSGTMQNLGCHFGWLIQALAAFAKVMKIPFETRLKLIDAARRLPDGIPSQWKALAQLRSAGLTRGHIAALMKDGFDSMGALLETEPSDLTHLLPLRMAKAACAAARAVESGNAVPELDLTELFDRRVPEEPIVEQKAPEARVLQVEPECAVAESPQLYHSHVLVIDESSPAEAWFHGNRVTLTPKQFGLLFLLARNPDKVVSYQDITDCLWPDAVVELQQIGTHCRAIRDKLVQHLPEGADRNVFTCFKGIGLKLNLPADKVSVKLRQAVVVGETFRDY